MRSGSNKKTLLRGDNSGMSLVEVTIGFVILTIIIGAVYQLISFSSNMYFESSDMRQEQAAFEEAIYKKDYEHADGVEYKKEEDLTAGDYVLEPAGDHADAETALELFTAGGSLYSMTSGSEDEGHIIRVYGFER